MFAFSPYLIDVFPIFRLVKPEIVILLQFSSNFHFGGPENGPKSEGLIKTIFYFSTFWTVLVPKF